MEKTYNLSYMKFEDDINLKNYKGWYCREFFRSSAFRESVLYLIDFVLIRIVGLLNSELHVSAFSCQRYLYGRYLQLPWSAVIRMEGAYAELRHISRGRRRNNLTTGEYFYHHNIPKAILTLLPLNLTSKSEILLKGLNFCSSGA